MEIINTLLSDKKSVIIMAIGYVIVMVVAFIIIWSPDKVLEISRYEPYNADAANKEIASKYFSTIQDISVYNTKSYLNEIISKSYLEYTNETVDSIMDRIKMSGVYPTVTNVKTYNSGDDVIYTGNLDVGSKVVPVCIIEHYPYDIELSLDNFLDYDTVNKSNLKNGVVFRIKDVYKNVEYIEYTLEVQNLSATSCNIDFSVASNVYITLNDSEKVYMNNVYDTNEFKNIELNNIALRKVIFKLSPSEQQNVQSINFKNVIIDGKKVDLQVEL